MNTGKRGCLLMQFEKIDRETWPRREYFEHYFGAVPCTYSMTVKLDITPILESGRKLYPSLLYYLTTIVNRHAEFRTAINSGGELGVYSEMVPSYTIFHRDTETFSCLWTDYQPELALFAMPTRRICGSMGRSMAWRQSPVCRKTALTFP